MNRTLATFAVSLLLLAIPSLATAEKKQTGPEASEEQNGPAGACGAAGGSWTADSEATDGGYCTCDDGMDTFPISGPGGETSYEECPSSNSGGGGGPSGGGTGGGSGGGTPGGSGGSGSSGTPSPPVDDRPLCTWKQRAKKWGIIIVGVGGAIDCGFGTHTVGCIIVGGDVLMGPDEWPDCRTPSGNSGGLPLWEEQDDEEEAASEHS